MTAPGSAKALAMWRRAAAGERSPEVDAWLAAVATSVVKDVFDAKFDRAGRRAEAALRALGFVGQVDKYEELRQLADAYPAEPASVIAKAAGLLTDVPLAKNLKTVQNVVDKHRAKRKG